LLGNKDACGGASTPEGAEDKRRAAAVELLKAGPGVAKTDAAKKDAFAAVFDNAVRVPHLELQPAVFNAGIDFDQVFAFVLSDAVTDRVFHERLQEKRRDLLIERGGIGVDFDSEAIAETLALNGRAVVFARADGGRPLLRR
jgi:hypothetical protein